MGPVRVAQGVRRDQLQAGLGSCRRTRSHAFQAVIGKTRSSPRASSGRIAWSTRPFIHGGASNICLIWCRGGLGLLDAYRKTTPQEPELPVFVEHNDDPSVSLLAALGRDTNG